MAEEFVDQTMTTEEPQVNPDMPDLPDFKNIKYEGDDGDREEKTEKVNAGYLVDENTILYYFNYIGEVCMGHCIKVLMDPELGEDMAWCYMANINDNWNTEMDLTPTGEQIGPFELVRKSSEVYLNDPSADLEDFIPTEWWKYANGDIVASEGG